MANRQLIVALVASAMLAGCSGEKAATPPDQLACADAAAPSRANFHSIVNRESDAPYPGADVLDDGVGGTLTVRHRVLISGRHFRDVRAVLSTQKALPAVVIHLDPEGVKALTKVHGRSSELIALRLDGALVTATYYSTSPEMAQIELFGAATQREAEALAEKIARAAKGCTKAPAKAA